MLTSGERDFAKLGSYQPQLFEMAANPPQRVCRDAVGENAVLNLCQFRSGVDLVCYITSELHTCHKVTAFTTPCQFLAAAFDLVFKG